MVICPFCKEENIDGVDECEECQQPLGFLSKPRASSKVEHSLIKDQVYMLGPRRPLSVDVATAVGTVLEMMVSRAIGCVVVTEYDQMVGIFTERDAAVAIERRRGQPLDAAGARVHDQGARHGHVRFADCLRAAQDGYRRLPTHAGNGRR